MTIHFQKKQRKTLLWPCRRSWDANIFYQSNKFTFLKLFYQKNILKDMFWFICLFLTFLYVQYLTANLHFTVSSDWITSSSINITSSKSFQHHELQHNIQTKIIHCLETITNFNVHLQSKRRAEGGQTSQSENMHYKIHTLLNYKLKSDVLSKKEIKMFLGGTTYR